MYGRVYYLVRRTQVKAYYIVLCIIIISTYTHNMGTIIQLYYVFIYICFVHCRERP